MRLPFTAESCSKRLIVGAACLSLVSRERGCNDVTVQGNQARCISQSMQSKYLKGEMHQPDHHIYTPPADAIPY